MTSDPDIDEAATLLLMLLLVEAILFAVQHWSELSTLLFISP